MHQGTDDKWLGVYDPRRTYEEGDVVYVPRRDVTSWWRKPLTRLGIGERRYVGSEFRVLALRND